MPALSSTSSTGSPPASAASSGTGGDRDRTGAPAAPGFALREALSGRPARFLCSSWPLRCWVHLLGGVFFGAVVLVGLSALVVLGTVLSVLGIGLLLLAGAALSGIPIAFVERRRLRLVDPVPLESAHRPAPERGSHRLRSLLAERATWRELGYAVLLAVVFTAAALGVTALLVLACILVSTPVLVWALAPESVMVLPGRAIADPVAALPFTLAGLLILVASAYAAGWLTVAQLRTARFLLGPSGGRADREVVELTRSRARLADAFEAERRRIERDLHDGAQQQLVALTMTLGLAELELREASPQAVALVSRGRTEARRALDQLRDLVRGIHPQVLTDHGLAAAVAELALGTPLQVDADIKLPGRLPEPVETTAYFTVSEALTNAVKHSGARRVGVCGRLEHGRLVLVITDDGQGGADPAAGTGLAGLADRLAILRGRLFVSSPAGGPTRLRVEVPCSG